MKIAIVTDAIAGTATAAMPVRIAMIPLTSSTVRARLRSAGDKRTPKTNPSTGLARGPRARWNGSVHSFAI
jgi:hypothetical protein